MVVTLMLGGADVGSADVGSGDTGGGDGGSVGVFVKIVALIFCCDSGSGGTVTVVAERYTVHMH